MTRVSVDFGTSNTVAVLGLPDGRVRPLLFDGSPTLPSSVFLDPAGGLLVGRDAVHSARTAPDRFEPNPKRRIDEHAVLLGDAEVPVVDLITAVLARVAGEARRVAGGPIDAVALTHPAAWAQTRRRVLVDAAGRAGIPPTVLVPEPVAAADSFLALAGDTPVGACVVVYDLGAGTFDASVVRRTATGFDVIAAEGLSQAGGLDIDAAVTGYLGAHLAGRDGGAFARLLNPTTTEERRANRLLWEDVRNAKELLSRATHTQVHVPLVGVDVPLGRDQFDLLARPILDATVNATRAAVNSAQVRPADLAGIYLVGGGSRIPLVSTLLTRAFGRTPTATEQPELVVAEGGLRATGAPAAGPAPQPTGQFQPPTGQFQPPTNQFQPPTNQFQPVTGPYQPPTNRFQPPTRAGRPHRKRNLLVAAGAAVVLVVALGAVGLWAVLRSRTVDVDRRIYAESGRTVTLVSMEVDGDRLRLDFLYRNGDDTAWALSCLPAATELRSSYLVVGRSTVYPAKTRCSAEEPRGHTYTLRPGHKLESYAEFPTVPEKGTRFALQWYTFPRITGLSI